MGPSVAGSDSFTLVYTESINNMALCALYMCRMQDAVSSLEMLRWPGLSRDRDIILRMGFL